MTAGSVVVAQGLRGPAAGGTFPNQRSDLCLLPWQADSYSIHHEGRQQNGKGRGLAKKTRDAEGACHAKMGATKDRNGMLLTEAEDIKKRWQEHTEELYKKDLHDPDNHDGVITHLEPDILECEVRWALGSITTSKVVEVMEFQLS